MTGCLTTINGETYAVAQSGEMRPIGAGQRKMIDRGKAKTTRKWIWDNMMRCRVEYDRLTLAMETGAAKHYAARHSNRKDMLAEIKKWKSLLTDLDVLTGEGR